MDKSQLSKPQPMEGIDQEKVFLKKLESMEVTNPAPIEPEKLPFIKKLQTKGLPIKVRGAKMVGPFKIPRFDPIKRPVTGGKTEKASEIKINDKQIGFLKMCQKKGETRIEQDKSARVLENFHL